MRYVARDIFLHALEQTSVSKAFAQNIHFSRGILRVCDDLYDVNSYARVTVISMGKAAHSMAEALGLQLGTFASGIVAGVTTGTTQLANFRYYQGGHPTPNAESVRAADAILRHVATRAERGLILYLLSGGASSIVERPLDDEVTLEDLIETYRVLVHSGAPIAEINAIRKHLSAIKGGRLAEAGAAAQQVSIMISDVPDVALDSLGSGPTMPDRSTAEDCYRIAHQHGMVEKFPRSVRELFERRALGETPKSEAAAFRRSRWWPILSNQTAREAAAARATAAGFAVEIDNTCDDWDYAEAADYLLKRLRELRRGVSKVCLISGGEVTVKVNSARAGRGGRNQQFALYCAERIASENITVMSAGTDGIDGNSPAAGAVADGSTKERATSAGKDTSAALANFDAFPLFESLEDAIVTGPTGNNVRDLRVLLAY